MIRGLLIVLSLVLASPAWSNPTLLGGSSQSPSSGNRCATPFTITHTVVANTDLLTVFVGMEGDDIIDSIEWNCTTACEALTLQVDSGNTASGQDIRVQIWTLLSPTITNDAYTISCTTVIKPSMFYALNWDNVDTTPGDEVDTSQFTVNTTAATTCDMSSSIGTANNTLISIASWQGGNAQPFTETAGWNGIFTDRSIGTANAGMSSNVFRESSPPNSLLTTATGAGASDQNACAMLELCDVGECGVAGGRTRRFL